MKHNTDSTLFRCTISGPSALIICPILCIGMLIAIVICSYYLAVIPLLLLCIPLYPLIGLGLWSTWKESAVLIITDKVVCLMRHGWYDRPFQKLYFSTLPYDSDEERQAAEGGINSKLATEIHQTENRPGTHCITVDRSSYRIVMLQKNVSMFSKTNDVVFRITKAKS